MLGVRFYGVTGGDRKPAGGEGRCQLSRGRRFQTEGATRASQICRAGRSQSGQSGDEVRETGGPIAKAHRGLMGRWRNRVKSGC